MTTASTVKTMERIRYHISHRIKSVKIKLPLSIYSTIHLTMSHWTEFMLLAYP